MAAPCPHCGVEVLLCAGLTRALQTQPEALDRPKRRFVREWMVVLAVAFINGWLAVWALDHLKLFDSLYDGRGMMLAVVMQAVSYYCGLTLAWIFCRWVVLRAVPSWRPKWPHHLTVLRRLGIILLSFAVVGYQQWLFVDGLYYMR